MKRLLFIAFWLVTAVNALAQTSTLPASLGTFNVFKESSVPVTLVMPAGYPIITPVVELWNNGTKLSDTTDVTVSGDTIKFTITKQQLAPLTRNGYLFIKLDGQYALGAPIIPQVGVGTPSSQNKIISLPANLGVLRVSLVGDASTAMQAANQTLKYRDSTYTLLNQSSAYILSRLKKGSAAALRANTELIDSWELIDGPRSGTFYYDPSDATSADDGAVVIVSGTRRYKRVIGTYVDPTWWGAVGDSTTNDSSPLQKAFVYAGAKKKVVWIDRAKGYRNSIVQVVQCDIAGFGKIYNQGGALNVTRDSLTIRDITIYGRGANLASTKANATGSGLSISYAKNVTVENVKVLDTGTANIYTIGTVNLKINNARTWRAWGNYGDGIYCGGAINPSITNCYVSEFERIGITFEQNSENAYAAGNTAADAMDNVGGQLNGGIWGENCRGAKFVNNTIRNTRDRGIVINGIVSNGQLYTYILTDNLIKNATIGMVANGGAGQTVQMKGGSIVDCYLSIETTEYDHTLIQNITFSRDQVAEADLGTPILLIPTRTVGKKSIYVIESCTNLRTFANNIFGIAFGSSSQYKADLYVRNNVGNFSLQNRPNLVEGSSYISNTNMDYRNIVDGASRALVNFNLGSTYEDCDIKLKLGNVFILQHANKFIRTSITSDTLTRLEVGNFGALSHVFEDCVLDYIEIYNIRRAGTSVVLKNNTITNYGPSGLLTTVVVGLGNIELINNKFSSIVAGAATVVPIQLGLAATSSTIGPNQAPSAFVTSLPNPKTTVPWEIELSGTAVPNKTGLNTLYGNLKAGSVVSYPSITGGGRDYKKLSDLNTSDWVESIWTTGVKSKLP